VKLWYPPPPPRPRPYDWLVVLDDIACHRVQRCTLCSGPLELFEVDAWSNGTVVATVVLCERCKGREEQREAVAALLEVRYQKRRETDG